MEKLLADTALMKEMLEAGGASGGKYGQAMQIYTDIQKASPKAGERHPAPAGAGHSFAACRAGGADAMPWPRTMLRPPWIR